LINSVIKEWFDRVVDMSFATMHMQLRKGVPTARLAAEFLAPSCLGGRLDLHSDVVRLNRSSLDLALRRPDQAVLLLDDYLGRSGDRRAGTMVAQLSLETEAELSEGFMR
jgi:hypothetical protein